MSLQRHFIGWDQPLTACVRAWLCPAPPDGPLDLERDLLVAPTRQAGRRLSDALAAWCGQHGTGLLSCRIVTPAFLLHEDPPLPNLADSLTAQALWYETLSRADPQALRALFPCKPQPREPAWALRTAAMIESLRATLNEAGLTIAALVDQQGELLEEAERWQCLAILERDYLATCAQHDRIDPLMRRLELSAHPTLPPGVERIIVAACPDPMDLAITALMNLADSGTEVHILVAAPESEADAFDKWGRPLAQAWLDRPPAIPDAAQTLILAADGVEQARLAVATMARAMPPFDPDAIGIGMPDRSLAPHLAAALEPHGIATFDPGDTFLKDHNLYRLIEAWAELTGPSERYSALRLFLRHPAVLDALAEQHAIPPGPLLTELDTFQNLRLPWTVEAVRAWTSETDAADFPTLTAAMQQVEAWRALYRPADLAGSLRAFLKAIFNHRMLAAGDPDAAGFEAAARCIDDALHAWQAIAPASAPHADAVANDGTSRGSHATGHAATTRPIATLPPDTARALLLRYLSEQPLPPRRTGPAIDLDGWLELSWNSAPLLIVTGMNEGIVPDGRPDDVFLPDTLKARLGMRDDRRRLTRDLYLAHGLVASRRANGRVFFLCAKTSDTGDPLRPSRVLLACDADELPGRVKQLFGQAEPPPPAPHATISFPLVPAQAEIPEGALPVTRLSVTAFAGYLDCPFRFYLSNVLKMEPLDDLKRAPDALDFGQLVHTALQRMSDVPDLAHGHDSEALADFLCDQAETVVRQQFGRHLTLPVMLALDAARQRLTAAARVQTNLAAEGWTIIGAERKLRTQLAGLTITGKLDRIDRHDKTGALRVIDYKSSDTPSAAAKAHLATVTPTTPAYARHASARREQRWINLQLPLYIVLLADCEPTLMSSLPVPAYFNLPKAVGDTGLAAWDAFDEPTLASARACAEAVAEQIGAGVFWPPSERPAHDDFESLFPLGVPGAITAPAGSPA